MHDFFAEVFSPVGDGERRHELIRLFREGGTDAASYVRSIFVPDDELFLVVFRARSAEDVAHLALAGGLEFDRIVPAAVES